MPSYVLGEPPKTSSETFDALENVFSADEFTQSEALKVFEEALDMSSSEAQSNFSRLVRMAAIEEV